MKLRILAMLLLFLVVVIASAQAPGRTWNFDTDTGGTIARGFSSEAGEWQVKMDASAPSKPNVLAQLAKSSRPDFNVTLVTDTNYRDVDLSVRMKAIAGTIDQGGGLVWRAKDAKNYYIARYNPLEDNYRVYKVVNGRRGLNSKMPTSRILMAGTRYESLCVTIASSATTMGRNISTFVIRRLRTPARSGCGPKRMHKANLMN